MTTINAQNQVESDATNLGISHLSVLCPSLPTSQYQINEPESPPQYKSLRQFEQHPYKLDTYPKDYFYFD